MPSSPNSMTTPPTHARPRSSARCHNVKHPITINDPIHDSITVPVELMPLLDSRPMQRLQSIKQTSVLYRVYPSAKCARFEHSVGTMHLADVMCTSLMSRGAPMTAHDRLVVMAAALLHDVGHGPFSHTFDGVYCPSRGINFRHEEMSAVIIQKELFENPAVDTSSFTVEDMNFILTAIDGVVRKPPGRPAEQDFLYSIVSDKLGGMDVDRMDYLMRDTLACSIGITFNRTALCRLMDNVRVVEIDGKMRLGFDDKVSKSVQTIGESRATLHTNLYQHKAVKAAELGLCKVIGLAESSGSAEFMIPTDDGRLMSLTECIKPENVSAYLKLTDGILDRIEWSTDESMKPARHALARWHTGRFDKILNTMHLDKIHFMDGLSSQEKEAKIMQEIGEFAIKFDRKPVDISRLSATTISFNYGMSKKDPIMEVAFFDSKLITDNSTIPTGFFQTEHTIPSINTAQSHHHSTAMVLMDVHGCDPIVVENTKLLVERALWHIGQKTETNVTPLKRVSVFMQIPLTLQRTPPQEHDRLTEKSKAKIPKLNL